MNTVSAERKNPNTTKRVKKFIIIGIIVVSLVVFIVILGMAPSFTITDDSITIHRDGGAVFMSYHFREGYTVKFGDIASIELFSENPRQLIDSYRDIPIVTRYRGANQWRIGYFGDYYLNVTEEGRNSPTLWITRYSNVPLVLHFPHGRTERLYEELYEAWNIYVDANR